MAGSRRRPFARRGRHAVSRWRGLRPLTALLTVIALSIGIGVGTAGSAVAAGGPAVVSVELAPVDSVDGTDQTALQWGTHSNQIGYRVKYSCATATCTGATIKLAAPPSDPSSFIPSPEPARLITFNTWTPPFAGATIAQAATGEVTVNLGDLDAGASGSFPVVYSITRTNIRMAPGQYFPDGFHLAMSATMDATNSVAPSDGPAAPVTWHIGGAPTPAIVADNPGTRKPDINIGFEVRFTTGSFSGPSGGNIAGNPAVVAAGSYTIVDTLPPEAEFVSATLRSGAADPIAPVYDAAAHTVTWTLGSKTDPDFWAGGGWGSTVGPQNHWNQRAPYATPRVITVRYPATAFADSPNPPDANGCNFEAQVTNSVTATVNYLDPAQTTTATAPSTQNYSIQCWDPFTQAEAGGKDSTSNGTEPDRITRDVWVPPSTTGMTCPATGRDAWGRACTPGGSVAAFANNDKAWTAVAYNEANIPGVAVITDDALDQADAHVTQIGQNGGNAAIARIDYTLDNGTTGTATTAPFTAPTGRYIVKSKVTSKPIPAAVITNSNPAKAKTSFSIAYFYGVTSTAPIGETRTNTAHMVMTYPGDADIPAQPDIDLGDWSRTIKFIAEPIVTEFAAHQAAAPVVSGGGNPAPGTNVTYSFNGYGQTRISGSTVLGGTPGDRDITPEYVFIAPLGWTIPQTTEPTFTGTVPAGVQFHYGTVTLSGQQREVVVASWPTTATFANGTGYWPTMNVIAQPTSAAGGKSAAPTYWISDSRNQFTNTTANFVGPVQNTVDVNADGQTSQYFASAAGTAIFVSGVASVAVVKSICQPDATQPDGCNWISTPGSIVGVSTTATAIKYRITVTNNGSSTLSNVVAYDLLPYVDDTGISAATASTPRGSTFQETLSGVSNVSPGVTLTYSTSTNPCRPEVYPNASNPGCVNNWNTTVSGSQALRATVTSLPVNASVSLTFNGAVAAGSAADALGCNSVAIVTSQTITSEPQAVCASTQQADLEVTTPAHLPLQQGRPGAVPFTVINHGGSQLSPTTVSVQIPAGLTVTNLTPSGYSCSDAAADPAPIAGPITLTCEAQNPDGTVRRLEKETPESLIIPVTVDPAAASPTCVDATVSGPLPDPETGNNNARTCSAVAEVTLPVMTVDKTDNAASVAVGALSSYSLTVASHLTSETIKNAVLTDTLPDGVSFVSASDGGTASGQTVTWNLTDLNPTGSPSTDGSDTSGGSGASVSVSVTVRVKAGAKDTVQNDAGVSAPDPAGGAALTDEASDTDTVLNVFTDGDPHEVTPQNQPVTTALSAIVSTTGAALDPTKVTQDTAPGHGSISIDPGTGAVTYLPTPGYSGDDSYQVQVCDTSSPAQCHVSTVTVTVGPNVVTAVNDTASTSALVPVDVDVTSNDLSQSHQPLGAPTQVSDPPHGTSTVLGNGQIHYVPDAGFSGTDTFTYQVCDTSSPSAVCGSATVTVTVANVFVDMDPTVPTAQNVPVVTPLADIVTTKGLPLDPARTVQKTAPGHGTITIDAGTGAVIYAPAPGYTGDDAYVITVCDTADVCHDSPVAVTVDKNVVVAVDDVDSTTPGVPVTTNVLGNDTSASGQPFALPSVTTDGAHGGAVVDGDGAISYAPDAGWSGVDSYVYQVCDTSTPEVVCGSATVTITVPNGFVDGDAVETTPHDTPVATVLADIVSVSGAPLDPTSVTEAAAPGHGSISIDAATGAVTYTPTDTYTGPDSYQVKVCDTSTPTAACHTSTVTVTVGANTVHATDDTDSTAPVTAVSTDVLGNDTTGSDQTPLDPASVTVTADPGHGTTGVDPATGKVTYTPDEDWSGVDSYIYEVCDTSTLEAVCRSATVTVTVDNVFTDGPAADGIETGQNAPLITPLAQIVATAGAPLNPAGVTTATDPAHGTVSIDTSTGAVTYAPAAGYSGPDSFDLQVCDRSTPDPQCHTLTIPVQVLDNVVTVQDFDLDTRVNTDLPGIDVLDSATSASEQPFAAPTIATNPGHGTATVNAEGTITYSPATDFDGTDSFTYTVCDTGSPKQACDSGTVTVTVRPVANLSTTKKLDSKTIVAGLPITYTTTVNNLGPSVASNVHSVDPINKVVTDPKGTPDDTVAGGTCLTRASTPDDLAGLSPAYGPYSLAQYPNVVECTYPAIPAGTSVHDTITGTVDAAALPGGTLVNQAPVFADTYDPDLSDNVASATGTITTSADAVLTKKAKTTHASIGDTVTFTLTVVNHGPSVAAEVAVNDQPTGMRFISADPSQGTFEGKTGAWKVGTLAVGQTVTAEVVEKITATGARNIADLAAATTDPNPANNGGRDCRTGTTGCGYVALDIDAITTVDHGSTPITGSTPNTGAGATGGTASTGIDAARLLEIALLFILAGAGALTLARRRRSS